MDSRNRIFLIGFSATGKSAAGRRAARLLDWEFVDVDEIIVEQAGKAIERIFAEDGEVAFRELERKAITGLAGRPHVVVSTGAGSVMLEQSRAVMWNSGLVIALDARPVTIHGRLTNIREMEGAEAMARPMLQSDDALNRIESLKRERQWAYALAHWTISTDFMGVEQVAHDIVRAWRRMGAAEAWANDPDIATTVALADGAYPVFVGWDILERQLGRRLIDNGLTGRAFIVCDSNVTHPYGRAAQRSLHKAGIEMGLFTVPAGEATKSVGTATVLYEWLAKRRAERRDVIVAVGGGVVGDLAGFVAATFLRGIEVVQVPTSLTAMVDSSIGGKTGVDLPAAKNMVGAFHHPSMVITDVAALKTLSRRAFLEGWAEAIKHGLAFDADLVEMYDQHAEKLLALDPAVTTCAVAWNAAIKARVVTEDERETSGRRQLLNYGHTIGHGLEAAAGYGSYLHGEAVAIGMSGAGRLGLMQGVTPAEVLDRQTALIERFGLPLGYRDVDPKAIIEAMSRDKKISAGEVSWVFLDGIGSSRTHRGTPAAQVSEVVADLQI